jgi:hypothetical protein
MAPPGPAAAWRAIPRHVARRRNRAPCPLSPLPTRANCSPGKRGSTMQTSALLSRDAPGARQTAPGSLTRTVALSLPLPCSTVSAKAFRLGEGGQTSVARRRRRDIPLDLRAARQLPSLGASRKGRSNDRHPKPGRVFHCFDQNDHPALPRDRLPLVPAAAWAACRECPASAPMGQIGVIEERRISGSS